MRQVPDALMLFSAGFGTRMGVLTRDRPKPLIPVGGKALIDHTLDLAQAVAPARVVANLHYLPDQITAHLKDRDIAFSHETPDILETGGGLRNALPLLGDGPVFATNTDAIWQGPNPFELVGEAWRPEEMDALLICIPRARALGHAGTGDFILNGDGRITRGPGHIYGGIQILRTDGLHEIAERAFSLNLVWNRMLERGRLFGIEYPGRWCDVGAPEGIALAETLLEGRHV